MAFFRFDDMDGNINNMMNQMMNTMFADPFSLTPFRHPAENIMSPFNHFNQIQSMIQQASSMPQTNGTSFVQSSFISYSSNGNNPPQVYEETKMNQVGPGGVREERHTVRDSRTGLQKMKIGRHIQDRGHVMERSKNHYTGEQEENNEYINIEEEEAPEFQREWSTRMQNHSRTNNGLMLQNAPNRVPRLAITAGPSVVHPDSPVPSSSTSSPNSHENRTKLKNKLLKNKRPKKPYKKTE